MKQSLIRKIVFLAVLVSTMCMFSVSMATDCIVTPKSLSMDFTSLPEAGQPIEFTLDAVSGCDTSLYYFFTFTPDYGSASYDAAANWVNMMTGSQDVSFTTSNSVMYTFANPGNYIVVADVMPSQSFPTVRNIIGTSLAVQESSGGDDECPFQATALNMTITDALTGYAISNATVTVMSQTATTNSAGQASFVNLPTNTDVLVTASANGYITQELHVRLACGEAQSQGLALLSSTDEGVTGGDFKVILTWGENPRDLDSHLTGPSYSGASSSERFHVAYYSRTNDVAWLDVDDVTSYGPETVTIESENGTFVPGVYRYYVHHYSGSSNIPNSGAVVQIYKGSTLLRSYSAPSTQDANVGDNYVWSVFDLTLTASGGYSITSVNSYSSQGYSSTDTTIFQQLPQVLPGLPEVNYLFNALPEK